MKKIINSQNIELFVVFILTLFFTMFCLRLTSDEIWNYGFAYNVINGLTPYKDFNMILTPLHTFITSFFLLIFGKGILSLHIFNAIICSVIFYFLRKNSDKYCYIVYILLLTRGNPNYNLLCLLFLFILINLENKKGNDYLIGIVLGLTFLTKQNIGIFLCIPTLFTKNVKKILKRIVGFLIPVSIFVIYLLFTNSLYDFVDYAFLGMTSFANENIYISYLIVIILVSLIYIIYKYIKTKEIKYIYLLMFQLIAYPIFGEYHVYIAFIPVLSDMLNNLKLYTPKLFFKIAFAFFIAMISVMNIINLNKKTIVINNGTNLFNYRMMDTSLVNAINEIGIYLKNNDNVYILNEFGYLYKLEANIPITKYDLLNNGNLGKNGENKYIEEFNKLCDNKFCSFLLQEKEYDRKRSQTNKKIYNYVKENYQMQDIVANFIVYRNEVVQ